MFETPSELAWLQELLDRSHATSTAHLRRIIDDERTLSAAAKARHLRPQPAVSVAHLDGEELTVFAHGRAEELGPGHPDRPAVLEHWTAHYGSSPLEWGEEVRIYRLQPHWMVGYAARREQLLAAHGIATA